jgi:recombinational DNA repair protein RecR
MCNKNVCFDYSQCLLISSRAAGVCQVLSDDNYKISLVINPGDNINLDEINNFQQNYNVKFKAILRLRKQEIAKYLLVNEICIYFTSNLKEAERINKEVGRIICVYLPTN